MKTDRYKQNAAENWNNGINLGVTAVCKKSLVVLILCIQFLKSKRTLIGFFKTTLLFSTQHWTKRVSDWYPDSKPAILCSYSTMLHAEHMSSKYQFYSLWFDMTVAQSQELTASKKSMLIIKPSRLSELKDESLYKWTGKVWTFRKKTKKIKFIKWQDKIMKCK